MNGFKAILENISIWIILLPLLTGSWFIKKMSRDSFIIFVLVIIATPPQLITAFFELRSNTLNLFYNVYTPIEFILLFFLFKPKFYSSVNKKIFIATGVLYVIISVLFLLLFNLSKVFVNEWACVNNLLYIVWILMYISEIFSFNFAEIKKDTAFSYFLLGIFLYAQCTVLLFALYYYISQSAVLGNTWIIQSLGNIAMYILFTLGILLDVKNKAARYPNIFTGKQTV